MPTLGLWVFSMANPQMENGHVKIANDIFEALMRIRISGEARQCLDTILRKTYGFNKKEDAISLSQFEHSTGMRKCDVIRGIKKLIEMNIISKKASGIANIYQINKDFDKWKPFAKKQRGVAKKQIIVCKKANNRLLKSNIQKTVTKDSIKRHSEASLGDEEDSQTIIDVIFAFKEVNLNYKQWFGRPPFRASASRMASNYGIEKVLRVIKLLTKTNKIPFMPTITTPIQLENKWSQLESQLIKEKNKLQKEAFSRITPDI
jgi:phage replication O-like protein O